MKNKRLIKKVEKSRELKIEIVKYCKDRNIDLKNLIIDLSIIKGEGKLFIVLVEITNEDIKEKFYVTMRDKKGSVTFISKDTNLLINNMIKTMKEQGKKGA